MIVMVLPSHADDGAARVTWPWRDVNVESCWRWRCRVMLVMALPGRLGYGTMSMLSHAGDSATESCC
jgi:hypothetical protein